MVAEFAPGSTLGHGEVREDKLRELRFGELDGNRRGGGLFDRSRHKCNGLIRRGLHAFIYDVIFRLVMFQFSWYSFYTA